MFRSQRPADYIKAYNIRPKRLKEQLVPTDKKLWQVDQYENFLDKRASALAEAANEWMAELGGAIGDGHGSKETRKHK